MAELFGPAMTNSSSGDSAPSVRNQVTIRVVGLTITVIDAASIIPIYALVVYLAVQKWRQQRSFRAASHVDVFTYHVAAFRLIWVLALCFYIGSYFPSSFELIGLTSYSLLAVTWYGENFIHVLICLEQYLAVVHPIIYRGLKNARGVRIRNISIGCVWLLSPAYSGLVNYDFNPKHPTMFMIPFAVCLVVVSFCCLSVLCVLIRPGPGEGGRVDQSKQRAFNTITAILIMLWVWLCGILVTYGIYGSPHVNQDTKNLLLNCLFVFNLPSGLIIPVLYLHRAGKLSLCFHDKG